MTLSDKKNSSFTRMRFIYLIIFLISALILSLYNNIIDRNRLLFICEKSAGTFLIDKATARVVNRQRLRCSSGLFDRKYCHAISFLSDSKIVHGLTTLGFSIDPDRDNKNFGIEYRIYDLGPRYFASRNFSGPAPGLWGFLGDLIPIGSPYNVSCFDV